MRQWLQKQPGSIMNTATSIETGTLRRQDIIEYEPLLKTALRGIIPFSSYGLMFPGQNPRRHGSGSAASLRARGAGE